MMFGRSEPGVNRWAWPAVAAVTLLAPALLLLHSAFVWRDLDAARDAFLRNLAASAAARASMGEALMDQEPAVAAYAIVDKPGTPVEERLLRGEQLYSLEKGREFWRVIVPIDSPSGTALARIDIAASAADFLTSRARQTLGVSLAAAIALLVLGAWALVARRRQARLEQLAEAGRMSAILAHEIRNPLGTIKGFTQLALERAGPDIAPMLESALRQAERLENLVSDLLNYTRPPKPVVRPTAWSEIAARLREHGIHTRNQSSAELVVDDSDTVFATDPAMLEQIQLNLVRNSLEAAASRVVVTASPNLIRVWDDGPGFSPEALAHAFEPFHTEKAQGTGLGLAVSKAMAAALGAQLRIVPAASGGTAMEMEWTT
jgi:two-component system sensor histidine kinase HydH